MEFNRDVGYWLVALEGALQRVENLPTPETDEMRRHLQSVKSLLWGQAANLRRVRDAVVAGDQARFVREMAELILLVASASDINRATESLMLKYNISDAEVDYRFRGK